MKVHVYSILWSEKFMLPHFLQHYSQYADRIFVTNDHSTDKAVKIAKEHSKVTLLDYEHSGLVEKEFSETFANLAKRYPSREYYLERNLLAYARIMDAKTADYRIRRGLRWYDTNA